MKQQPDPDLIVDPPVIRDPAGGANQLGVRDHNERLVLSLIQRHGSLASAEIARRTRLSAQTVSVIIRALEAAGLLRRGEPQRGKVGKPLTPVMLNPDGILSLGLKIGRRSCDVVLVDVTGRIRDRVGTTYPYPTPDRVMTFLAEGLVRFHDRLQPALRSRIAGIGVAAPFELWNWLDTVNASPRAMESWRGFDLAAAIGAICDYPVHVSNDATAACAAELMFGRGRELADYAYFFVGYFTGGGVVLNDAVYSGRTGNAGSFGTLPVGSTVAPEHQLIHNSSLYLLERALTRDGKDPMQIWNQPDDWAGFPAELDAWIARAGRHLAVAAVAVCSVIDFQGVLIDGGFPPPVRARLVAEIDRHLDEIDTQGIARPRILEAAVGAQAREIGAASLPISAQFLLTQRAFAA